MTRDEIIKQLNSEKFKMNGSNPMSELTKREYFSIKILSALITDGNDNGESVGCLLV